MRYHLSDRFIPINSAVNTQEAKEYASPFVKCDWDELRMQLLLQWPELSASDVDKAGPDRHMLAQLIERKYDVSSDMIENYLRNFERTIPMSATM